VSRPLEALGAATQDAIFGPADLNCEETKKRRSEGSTLRFFDSSQF
jgi:hypothetical protein